MRTHPHLTCRPCVSIIGPHYGEHQTPVWCTARWDAVWAWPIWWLDVVMWLQMWRMTLWCCCGKWHRGMSTHRCTKGIGVRWLSSPRWTCWRALSQKIRAVIAGLQRRRLQWQPWLQKVDQGCSLYTTGCNIAAGRTVIRGKNKVRRKMQLDSRTIGYGKTKAG